MNKQTQKELIENGYYLVSCANSIEQSSMAKSYKAKGYNVRKLNSTTRVRGYYEYSLFVRAPRMEAMQTYGMFDLNNNFLGYAMGTLNSLKDEASLKEMPIAYLVQYTKDGYVGEQISW